MKRTAVIILNWNGAHMLCKFLPSVIRNTPEADIIVADNASTDDSLEILKRDFPTVQTIILDKNYGFAEGYNRAIAQVEHEYVVLLNSDIEVTANWLCHLTEFMDAHPDVAVCQPKLLSYSDRTKFEYAGACGGYIDRLGYPFCRGRLFDTVETDDGQYDDCRIYDCLWATGACLMVRRQDYIDAKGLDGRFFAHNEEIDLCWRLRLLGRRVTSVMASKVYHVGGGTLPQGNPRKTYLNFRNNLTMLYKNLPEAELNGVMRWRLVLDYVAALQSLLKGNVGDVKAICRARRDFARWKHQFDDDRKWIQSHAIVASPPERTGYSILYQYFIKRKKTFKQL